MQHSQTVGAILDLRQRFFAARVQNQLARSGHGPGHLQQKRGLADARLTAHEQGASRNKAPAEHAVQRIKPRAERLVP